MNASSEDIKDYLESSAVSIATFGTDMFISEFPNKPDSCICLKDSASWKSPETNYRMEYPGIQILIRDSPSGYTTAWERAEEIKDELHALTNLRQGAYYVSIALEGDIMYIGRDGSNRPIFSLNFIIIRQV